MPRTVGLCPAYSILASWVKLSKSVGMGTSAPEESTRVASIAAPLSIGTLTITDGRDVKGFLVEAEATRDARDISAFGGWRSFMKQVKVSA